MLLLSMLLLSTAGCGSESEPTSEEPAVRQTLLFIDRSASTGAYPDAEAIFADSLRHLIRTRVRRPGDRLSLFIVHEKTLSKSPRLDLKNQVRALEDKPFADEQALETARYKKELEEEFRRLETEAQAFIDTADRGVFAQWTDLWGSLGVASEELEASADGAIYYFSDMFESMPGPERRDFDASTPRSRSEATEWAAADADKLSDLMVLKPERLTEARVRVLMGPLATKSGAQPVKFYWLALFDEMGLTRVDYN